MNIGENIQKYRKKQGLTQKKLAELCGLATGTIQQYELGKRKPNIDTLKIISEKLEISINELLTQSEYISQDELHDDLKKDDEPNYYVDPETRRIAQRIFEDSDMHTLFDIAKDMEPDRLQAHIDFMKSLKKSEEHNED